MNLDVGSQAWLPRSIADATLTGLPANTDLASAWSHLLRKLEAAAQIVDSDPVNRNRDDLASGMRHLLVLLAAGVDEVLRFDPDPILSVQRTSTETSSRGEWNARTACTPAPRCGVAKATGYPVAAAPPGMSACRR